MAGIDPASLALGGIQGAFNYAGAKSQANAQKEAAANALAFSKQQYSDLTGRLSPYIASGKNANDLMTGLIQSSPYAAQARRALGPQPPPPSVALVTLQAPDGTMKKVPQDQVDHYISKGAVPLNG